MTSTDHPEPLAIILGAPHTFCDRFCERCAVADGCAVWQAARARERDHEQRGEPPGDRDVVLADLEATLRTSLEVAEKVACEQGLDLDAPVEPRPRNLLAERLRAESMDLSRALRDLLESPGGCRAASRPGGQAVVEEIVRAAFLIPAKVARLASYLDGNKEFHPALVGNAAATFALLERIEQALGEALAAFRVWSGAAANALRRAHARLWRLLIPLQSTLPVEPRLALDALIARGRAPSPFCVRRQGGGLNETRLRTEPEPPAPQTAASMVTPPSARSLLEYVRRS